MCDILNPSHLQGVVPLNFHIYKVCIFKPASPGDNCLLLTLITRMQSLIDSETTKKSAIFKLLELPWYSPNFPVHSHYITLKPLKNRRRINNY